MKIWALALFLLLPLPGWAKLALPKSMNHAHRLQALEILGYGSATKVLGDPYPLGGYSGVELGVTYEVIPTTDLSRFGAGAEPQGETSYMQLTFAKGLYYNFDVFVNFAPFGQTEEVSSFGGGLRWGFFEAEYLPIALSLQLGANSTSFQNKIDVSSQTLDLLASFVVEDVTLYLGAGSIRASGTFLGGTNGVTDSNNVESETVTDTRFLAGVAVKFSKFFGAVELDRVTQPNYSAKLGVRF